MVAPRVLILRAPGTNCDFETEHAFERAGAVGDRVHINRILETPTRMNDYQILCIPGGFSYGDDVGAGKILANQMRHHLVDVMQQFKSQDKLLLGICNGFQVLLEAGLLPGSMRRNKRLEFICEHVNLRVEQTDTPFTLKASAGQLLRIPIAHGEGNYYAPPETVEKLETDRRIIFRYTSPTGAVDEMWNVNGSVASIAGICNETRNVVGLMPHPERACEQEIGSTDGRIILESVIGAL